MLIRRLTSLNPSLGASRLVCLVPLLVLHLSVRITKIAKRHHFHLVPPLPPIPLGNRRMRRRAKTTTLVLSEEMPRLRALSHLARKLWSRRHPFQGRPLLASHLVNHSQQHHHKLRRLFHSVPPLRTTTRFPKYRLTQDLRRAAHQPSINPVHFLSPLQPLQAIIILSHLVLANLRRLLEATQASPKHLELLTEVSHSVSQMVQLHHKPPLHSKCNLLLVVTYSQ